MGLGAGALAKSSDITALKTRIKAEMARRKYQDSLASFATNFTDSASAGQPIKMSHFNESVGYINKIKTTGISNALLYSIRAAEQALTNYEDTDVTATVTDCTSSSCRGLCYTACTGGCKSGCTGGCSSSCTGGCRGSCSSCAGGCSSSCGSACSSTCSDICTTAHGSCSNEASSVPGHT